MASKERIAFPMSMYKGIDPFRYQLAVTHGQERANIQRIPKKAEPKSS